MVQKNGGKASKLKNNYIILQDVTDTSNRTDCFDTVDVYGRRAIDQDWIYQR